MCGIVTVVGKEKNKVTENCQNILKKLKHRGEDYSCVEFYKFDNCAVSIGHNRLSINDLSESGNQPMHYEYLRLIVNGEIWNYKEFKERYKKKYTFQSNSDSEVILFAYLEDDLKKLDGMFSFVLLDMSLNKLIVSRDWVGKVPLYMSVTSNIYISSELQSFPKELQKTCKFVPRNSLIEIDLKDLSLDVKDDYYFKFDSSKQYEGISHNLVAFNTYELLDIAVQKRLMSDVPIATLNSGGIDSSIITYLSSKYITDVTSYTVHFDEESKDLEMARLLADKTGINLVEVKVPKDDELIKERFLEVIKVIGYPLTVQVEVGILCSFMAEKIKEDGFKVVLSGEGADEAYGSYGMLRMYANKPDWSDIRKELFEKQYYGNLLRGNNIFMKYGTIELRTPFFDKYFLNYTLNLSNKYTSQKSIWKLPLVNAFKGLLPDEILTQSKRAFQKGTNFKDYFEELILDDTDINFNRRSSVLHVINDQFKEEFGITAKQLRKPIKTTNEGLSKWF